MTRFSLWDVVVVGVYFVIVLSIGSWAKRKDRTSLEYFLAGRSLTLPIFVMTLVSTWYGGILGVGEYSYRYGLANWVTQGFPYYFFAALFALFLAHRVRKSEAITIPDQLERAFGRRAGLLGALFTFFLVAPAPYILMLGVLLQMMTGFSLLISLIIGAALSLVYLVAGGFRADVYTDVFEFFVMFLGVAIILPFCFHSFGGLNEIREHVPPLHFSLTGEEKLQKIVVWFLLAMQTFVDPTFFQRCAAAKSPAIARRGILISILFWFVFDAMTTTAGLYARAQLPDLKDPMMAFPLLAEKVLPAGVKGFFYAGMLATIMSTLNSSSFVSATTLGRDLFLRWRGLRSEAKEQSLTVVCLIFTTIVSIGLANYLPSVVDLWYSIGSIFVPGLLVPLLLSYSSKPRKGMGLVMLAGWLSALCWSFLNPKPLGIEPMFVGLAVSLLSWLTATLVSPRAHSHFK